MEARPDISYGNVRGLVNVVLGIYCEKMIHVMFLDMNVLYYYLIQTLDNVRICYY